MQIKKILWASDGSKESLEALKWVVIFVTRYGAKMTALNVIESPNISPLKVSNDLKRDISLIDFVSPGGLVPDKRRVYAAAGRLRLNQWAVSGDWTIGKQPAVLNEANGRIACRFHARDLHLVMAPRVRGISVQFRVLMDGQSPGAAHGIDVDAQGNGTLAEPRLYQLIRQPKPITERQFEIEFLSRGVEAFAFTFG
jgi:hypothetical protein